MSQWKIEVNNEGIGLKNERAIEIEGEREREGEC